MARKKSTRLRQRNSRGRPPAQHNGVVTQQQIDRRRQLVPGLSTEDLMKQRAGIPLEILATRGLVSEAQRSAGEQFGELVHRWRRLHQVPDDRRQKIGGPVGGEMDPRQVAKVNDAMNTATAALGICTPLARAAVESVCVDEEIGRLLDSSPIGARLTHALLDGLNALGRVFKVSSRRAA